MLTSRPLTVMWPWVIIMPRLGRDWAKPSRQTMLSRRRSKQGHQRLAGVALGPLGLLEILAELPFQHAVVALHLLLLAEVGAVIGQLAAAAGVHARRRLAPFTPHLGVSQRVP